MYLDPNQNDYADTVAAPYSVRPFDKPNVSAPIDWRELKDSLRPEDFTIRNMARRLEKKGDIFDGVADKKIALANDLRLQRFL